MRRIANRMLEWLFPALREWRIEAELEDGGEDAVSERDRAWAARRAARLAAQRGMHNAQCTMTGGGR